MEKESGLQDYVHDSMQNKTSTNTSKQPHRSESSAICNVTHPRIVFFIRIPKSASTSFVDLLKSLAPSMNYTLLFNPSGAYDWNDAATKKEAKLVMSKTGKVVYTRHFYYVDFKRFGVRNFTYATVIRDPIERFISSYLYYHYSSKKHIQRMLKPQHRNESIVECTKRKHNGCAHNWLTKYFCGHHKHCTAGGADALAIAKDNMLHKFAVVGLLEELDLSLQMFSAILPGFFTMSQRDILPKSNKNERSMSLNSEEEEVVRTANSADMELYAYARNILHAAVVPCKFKL